MQEERYGSRDRSYSAWHRRMSTQRFVGIERAQSLAMIDLDASLYVEYDDGSKEPLALIETARDVGQPHKPATVTTKLAQLCTKRLLPAYVLLYTLSDSVRNPADAEWFDIEKFRYRRLWPKPDNSWNSATPAEWAANLVLLRERCAAKVDRQIEQPSADIADNSLEEVRNAVEIYRASPAFQKSMFGA